MHRRGGYLSSLLQHLAPSSWRSSSSTSSPPTENDSNEIVAGVVEDEAVEMPEVETAVSTIEPTVTVVGRSVVDLEKEFGVAIRCVAFLLGMFVFMNRAFFWSTHSRDA